MSDEDFQRHEWNGYEWVPVEGVPARRETPSAPALQPQQWPQTMGQPVYVVNQGDPGGRAVSLALIWMLAFMWLLTAPCWFCGISLVGAAATTDSGDAATGVVAVVTLIGTAVISLAPMALALFATIRRPS